jgi:transcriptional regulator with XRE-family HTH domain
MQVGAQIKEIRKSRKISLVELSRTSGVQIATISRIENGKMTGTLESHLKIAKALAIPVTRLYQDIEDISPRPIHGSMPQGNAPLGETGAAKEILARQVTGKKMLPLLIRIDPGTKTESETHPAGSERFIFIIKGEIILHLDREHIRLTSNTSLYFNSDVPHLFENPVETQAKFLSVTTPVAI